MVPTSSGFADTSITGSEEEDFYLHLHLPPELDLPLPATTQIYHQPPTSYLIPRWDLGPNSGAFTKIEFPAEGTRPGLREDVDTFETILAQCTAFLERAAPPKPPRGSSKSGGQSKAREAGFEDPPPYNPASFEAGEGYAHGSRSSKMMDGGPSSGGRIVLVDEEDGSVIGELSEGLVVKDSGIYPGSKGERLHSRNLEKIILLQLLTLPTIQTLFKSPSQRKGGTPLQFSPPLSKISMKQCIPHTKSQALSTTHSKPRGSLSPHPIMFQMQCCTAQTPTQKPQSRMPSL